MRTFASSLALCCSFCNAICSRYFSLSNASAYLPLPACGTGRDCAPPSLFTQEGILVRYISAPPPREVGHRNAPPPSPTRWYDSLARHALLPRSTCGYTAYTGRTHAACTHMDARRAAPCSPLLSSPRGGRRCIVRSCVRNAVAAGVRHTRNMYPPRRAVRSPWLCTAPLTAASFGARVHDAHRSTTGTERCGSRAQRAHDARGPRARRMLAVCTSPRAAPTVSLAAAHLAARGSPPHRSLSYHIVHSRVPYAATTHITPTWALRRHGGASHC